MVDEDFEYCPCDENCFQLGAEDYYYGSRLEFKYFKMQIERKMDPAIFSQVSLRLKANDHDMGTYYTVRVTAESYDLINEVENCLPYRWDKDIFDMMKAEFTKETGRPFPYECAENLKND